MMLFVLLILFIAYIKADFNVSGFEFTIVYEGKNSSWWNTNATLYAEVFCNFYLEILNLTNIANCTVVGVRDIAVYSSSQSSQNNSIQSNNALTYADNDNFNYPATIEVLAAVFLIYEGYELLELLNKVRNIEEIAVTTLEEFEGPTMSMDTIMKFWREFSESPFFWDFFLIVVSRRLQPLTYEQSITNIPQYIYGMTAISLADLPTYDSNASDDDKHTNWLLISTIIVSILLAVSVFVNVYYLWWKKRAIISKTGDTEVAETVNVIGDFQLSIVDK